MNITLEENEENSATKLLNRLRTLSLIGIVIAVVALMFYFAKFHEGLAEKAEAWGQFGDFIGGVLNPAFSLLALLALLATFNLQIQEFRLSTKELQNSAEALSAQHVAMQRQIFENTFFQLLNLHNQLLDNIDLIGRGGETFKGRDCFKIFANRANTSIVALKGAKNDLDVFRVAYKEFQKAHEREVGHYFRTLYNLLKFIDSANGVDSRFYTNIVRAQLSSDEVTLLMYNCMSETGHKKFKPLVERYSLLKGLTEVFISTGLVEKVYSPKAFGENHSLVHGSL
jgi:uncharacterized membrane protein